MEAILHAAEAMCEYEPETPAWMQLFIGVARKYACKHRRAELEEWRKDALARISDAESDCSGGGPNAHLEIYRIAPTLIWMAQHQVDHDWSYHDWFIESCSWIPLQSEDNERFAEDALINYLYGRSE